MDSFHSEIQGPVFLSIGPDAKLDMLKTSDLNKTFDLHLDPPSSENPPLCRITQDGKDPIITTDFYLTNMEPREWILPTPPRQNQVATTDTSELSSFSLSELPVDQSGPPAMIQTTEAAQDELSFQPVIPNVLQQSLYPSLVAMGSSPNTAISPSIPLSRRVINDIEEHQRTVLNSYVEGMDRGMNTSPVKSPDEQQDETKTTSKG